MSASEKLRQLNEQATPGVWKHFRSLRQGGGEVSRIGADDDIAFAGSSDDAELIVTLRNCLPEICDLIDGLESFLAFSTNNTDEVGVAGNAQYISTDTALAAGKRAESMFAALAALERKLE